MERSAVLTNINTKVKATKYFWGIHFTLNFCVNGILDIGCGAEGVSSQAPRPAHLQCGETERTILGMNHEHSRDGHSRGLWASLSQRFWNPSIGDSRPFRPVVVLKSSSLNRVLQ